MALEVLVLLVDVCQNVRNSGQEYGACSVLFFCSVVDFWTRSFGRCTRFPNRNPPIDPLNTEVALLPLVVLLLVQGVAAGVEMEEH